MAGSRPRLWIGVPIAVDPSGRRLLAPSGATSSTTAPASPTLGDLWYDSGNDVLNFYDGTNWVPVPMGDPRDGLLYARRDGEWSLVPIPDIPDEVSILPVGGRLQIVGSSPANQIAYVPYRGSWLRVNGQDYPLPPTGVTTTTSNVFIDGVGGQTLANNTTYFVYAFDNAGTLTFDFSATGYTTSTSLTNAGVQIKQGDDTRTLVGLVRPSAGQFLDDPINRLVRSWLNRSSIRGYVAWVTPGSGIGTWSALGAVNFLVFDNDLIQTICNGSFSPTTVGQVVVGIGYNGGTPVVSLSAIGAAGGLFNISVADSKLGNLGYGADDVGGGDGLITISQNILAPAGLTLSVISMALIVSVQG